MIFRRRRIVSTLCTNPPRFATLCAAFLVFIGHPSSLSAVQRSDRQTLAVAAGTIAGQIIDASTGQPLPLAQVYLEPVAEGARPTVASSDGRPRATHTVATDDAGGYRFERLQPGAYRISVQRPGYQPARIEVDLVGSSTAQVTIGLQLAPVPLPSVQVTADPPQPFTRGSSRPAELAGARRIVAESRQAAYLETDARTITARDVIEAVTLAESDIFRALQRLPGVSRRDDYTAVLWTRGAPWVQTKVYFDGLPLYNPTHGGWLFSAVNPDGVGAAMFQPGVRSAAWGEGAAGIVDLRSRTGSISGGTSWRGELSLASVKLAGDGSLPGGITWMLAGRRTYVDVLSYTAEALGAGSDLHVPYDFADVTGRLDVPLFAGARLEASGLAESDRLRGDVTDLIERNTADWGNRAAQVTLRVPVGPVEFSATRGGTRFSVDVDEEAIGASEESTPTLSALENSIDHDRRALRLDGRFGERIPAWSLGFERIRERLYYKGPFSLAGEGIPGLRIARSPYELTLPPNDYDAWWGDVRFNLFERLDLQGGLRYEAGDPVQNGGRTRTSPRLSSRLRLGQGTVLSAGWGRSYQYTQAIGASGGPLGPQLHLGNLWIQAATGFPALRSEIFTVGAERWLPNDWLLGVNTYFRDVTGVAEPLPTPGVITGSEDLSVARNVARGLELSARRMVGSWTFNLGYAYSDSEMRTEEFRYPSPSDVRHTLDMTTSYRWASGLRLGGAFSVASGVPYTRIVVADPPRRELPNDRRTPAYVGLDAMLDYSRTLGDREVSAYLQLLNVLGRANSVTYAGSREECPDGPGEPGKLCPGGRIVDDFRSGLPRLPLFGVRVSF